MRRMISFLVLAAVSCGDPTPQRPQRHRPPAHPAIVTFVRGTARLGTEIAPSVPFRIPADRTLRLEEGAHAVVLVSHRPHRIDGPTDVDVRALDREPGSSAQDAVIRGIVAGPAPDAPTEDVLVSPAPNDLDTIRVVVGEGVPGASNKLGRIEWTCDGECAREVELRDGNGSVLWRAQGEGAVSYDGPDLVAPSAYTLRIGERSYEVETLPRIAFDELFAEMRGWPLPEQMSVIAALHFWSGSRAAAVATLRSALREDRFDADMLGLLSAYRARP